MLSSWKFRVQKAMWRWRNKSGNYNVHGLHVFPSVPSHFQNQDAGLGGSFFWSRITEVEHSLDNVMLKTQEHVITDQSFLIWTHTIKFLTVSLGSGLSYVNE